jgi:hypothetical protein
MDIKEYIKSLVRELLDEESTSGDAGGYLSPMAFAKKGQGQNTATKQAQRSGWKLADGMPKNSKVLDYKELWKGKHSAMNENSDGLKVGDKVKHENQDWEIEKVLDTQYRLKNLKGLPSTNVLKSTIDRENKKSSMNENMSTAERLLKQAEKEGHIKGDYSQRVLDAAKKVAKEYDDLRNDEERKTLRDTYYNKFLKMSGLKESLISIIKQELLNEVTYSKFKKDVKHRTKSEQLHKAIREVKRKLAEIDRIVEYTSRMKQELSEDEGGISYWKATQKNVSQISEMVNHLNNKIKNLQQ